MSVPDRSLAEQFAACRPVLLRFARMQLRDETAIEDAVQDTLVAALQAQESFRGEASVQTWLIGILRRKLVDRARVRGRELTHGEAGIDTDAADESGLLNRLFDRHGHWAAAPAAWRDPDAALEQSAFFEAFETCVRGLPERAAQAFVLREVHGLDAEEICKECGLTASNYWVLMHRARLRLRDCLEKRWFGKA